MTQTRQLLRSFAGGEITPELYGRLDLSKFQTGLALAQNFRTLPHGPATRRPGTRYVNNVANDIGVARIIPFAFSADQTMVIELTNGLIRFHTQNGTLVENSKAITGITMANPGVFSVPAHGWAVGDVIYLGDLPDYPLINEQFFHITGGGVNAVTLEYISGGTVDMTGQPAWVAGGTAARVYSILSSYSSADIFDIHFAQSADVLTLVHPSYPARELRRLSALNWTLTDVGFGTSIAAPTGVVGVVTIASSVLNPSSAPQTNEYVVTAVSSDGVSESLASAPSAVNNNLNVQGAANQVSWNPVGGAAFYNVYRRRAAGGVYGFIGQTAALAMADDNVLPDMTIVPPETRITLNTGAGDRPSAVTYGEQRRWFAATDNQPQAIWATRVGATSNLNSSFPSQPDDAMKFTIAAQQQNRIRHLVWLSDLLALTAGGEFRIFSQDAPAITPTTLSIKPQGYAGASNVSPVVTTASVLYVQAQGAQIRELSFNADTNSFATINMSVMAPHLFEGFEIVDITFARAPEPTLYAVRSDGMLLGLTYVPEQQVYGWHRVVTDGFVESVCVVAEGNEDALYMVVRREINGNTFRLIERMSTRFFDTKDDAYFVDSGFTKTYAAPTNEIHGLWHLEGKTVSVLGDGADLNDHVVENGMVTLTEEVSKVQIGLPYVSDLQFLPMVIDGMAAAGQGSVKNVTKVHMKLRKSSAFLVGPSFDRMVEPPMRDVEVPYDSPPDLYDGMLTVDLHPSWNPDGTLCVRQDRPLPLTIVAVVPELAVGR